MNRSQALRRLEDWFASRGWRSLPFQRAMWRHYLAGESGLLHTPTGSGKTLAMFGGPLLQAMIDPPPSPRRASAVRPLQVLWVTPLRALASDTARALQTVVDGLGLGWRVGLRSGDASNRERRQAREGRIDVLVTTPESLALLLSYPDTLPRMQRLRCMVVDEWHELLGNKRGVLLQLNLAVLRQAAPASQLWGLSATLGDLHEARDVLLPGQPDAPIVQGVRPRAVSVRSVLPDPGEHFPWAGHLGLAQLPRVLDALMQARSSLLFTNTRAQAELWHQALAAVWPEEPDTLALHHGSLDPVLRQQVEDGLRAGALRCVVATSSLDLGVDFPEVEQVLQLGSPKGVARLRQRAGRARHRPGASGSILCVPTMRWNWPSTPPCAVRWPGTWSKRAGRRRCRWMCWPSMRSAAPWRAASTAPTCWRRCGVPMPSRRSATTSGRPCSHSSCRVAKRWPSTPISTRSCVMPMGGTACTTVARRCVIGCRSAPSAAMAACACSSCAAAAWAPWRNSSPAACAVATASSSPGACWSWCSCAT